MLNNQSIEKYLDQELVAFKQRVLSFLGTLDGLAFGRGDPYSPTYNANHNSALNAVGVRYVVYLCPCKEVFIVWNYAGRKDQGSFSKTFSVGTSITWENLLKSSDHPITWPYYKELHGRQRSVEKVHVVHLNDAKDFFQHLDEYMEFNEFDSDKSGKACWRTVWDRIPPDVSNTSRREYSALKRQRAADFREKVLDAYGWKCAICRSEIKSVLQAAHLHGHEVAKTNLDEDIPENGICLCANHHLMYDSDTIGINIETRTLSILKEKERIEKTEWYNRFLNKYHASLIQPR